MTVYKSSLTASLNPKSIIGRNNNTGGTNSATVPSPPLYPINNPPQIQLNNNNNDPFSESKHTSNNNSDFNTTDSNSNTRIPSSWDPQDDILLRHLKEIKKLGWKEIAQYFTNRTPNACQFRWRRLKSGSLKHKSVASTMELTSSDLENVQVPEKKTIIAPTGLSAGNINTRKNITIRSRSSSLSKQSITNTNTNHNTNQAKTSSIVTTASKFLKPRSCSSTNVLQRPTLSDNNYSYLDGSTNIQDGENIGFIPKVIVKSRRGSCVSLNTSTNTCSTSSNIVLNDNNTKNIALSTPKSRKNSFSSRSRTNSFHMSERRLSVLLTSNNVAAGTSTATNNNNANTGTNSSPNSRRSSFVVTDSNSTPLKSGFFRLRRQSSNLTNNRPIIYNNNSHSSININNTNIATNTATTQQWTKEEEALLLNKTLSVDELDVLLPHKSNKEIHQRLYELRKPSILGSANVYSSSSAIVDDDSSGSSSKSSSPPIFSDSEHQSTSDSTTTTDTTGISGNSQTLVVQQQQQQHRPVYGNFNVSNSTMYQSKQNSLPSLNSIFKEFL
ncbi:SANT/Myb-like DNA-binding domain-containing protein SCDLUD_000202 [Saccharomycodes ludwigii]|uniref:SANT/Myb-like DNA-binding domain-containing protein n=1 Tax=Saccharomycodes ludwigii TaxID=36035 RepID=UPI001E841358|nr:hypothetical protein SCDLUD_000202 [Saccharomycodes ludwigii]KAH3902622.1 hypothetical protein SCDLUD_000202 [Saccharomycodes ludwigii]